MEREKVRWRRDKDWGRGCVTTGALAVVKLRLTLVLLSLRERRGPALLNSCRLITCEVYQNKPLHNSSIRDETFGFCRFLFSLLLFFFKVWLPLLYIWVNINPYDVTECMRKYVLPGLSFCKWWTLPDFSYNKKSSSKCGNTTKRFTSVHVHYSDKLMLQIHTQTADLLTYSLHNEYHIHYL